MDSKFFGPYLAVKEARLNPRGSIILFSGILSRRPDKGAPILAAVNAAVETLGKALAVELAPVRVNVISPGMTQDTGAYLAMPDQAREAMFKGVAQSLPVKRVGLPADIASVAIELMSNSFITGTVIDVDGGGLLS
jgi:NAD(P)-dependent dehydrogenase (short-subunit alcohol dehydrogenase family)